MSILSQIFVVFIVILLLIFAFSLMGKFQRWDNSMGSSFECGFMSFYYSRYSFSIHFVKVSLIFLFLDLELCVFFPYLLDSVSSPSLSYFFVMFFLILLAGLIFELKEKQIDWSEDLL